MQEVKPVVVRETRAKAITIQGSTDVSLLLGAIDWLRAHPAWLLLDISVGGEDRDLFLTMYLEAQPLR